MNKPIPKLTPAARKAMERMSVNTERIATVQSGVSPKLRNIGGTIQQIDQAVQSTVTRAYNQFVGIGENDLSAQEINRILSISQAKTGQRKSDIKHRIESFKKAVKDDVRVEELVRQRRDYKSSLYSSYELILSIIPKMRLALNTMANSIISPDDFSKKSLSYFFDENSISADGIEKVKERLKTIIAKYDLEKDLNEDVIEYLIKGERFWAVLSMNESIRQMLKESVTEKNNGYQTLSESCCAEMLNKSTATYEDRALLSEGLAIFSESNKGLTEEKLVQDLQVFLAEGMVIGDSMAFLSEAERTIEELNKAAFLNKRPIGQASEAADGLSASQIGRLSFGQDRAVLRRLKPECVVKLEYDKKVYGYLYIDSIINDTPLSTTARTRQTQSLSGTYTNAGTNPVPTGNVVYAATDIDRNGGTQSLLDPKLRFIADVFANRLSKKENIRLLKKNEQLKSAIYHTLLARRIGRDEKIRVVFFTPDEVVHIDRKESIFDNILFFAKLYIATLITILMQNIVRGADKRSYYIDIGLENDAANAIQSTIRDIKSKDLSQIHNMDLVSTINLLGDFNDYYIPTIDGERPINIESVDGLQNVSLDNDFLNWLSNNIFSGIGLPAAYLTEVESIDFAKALSMQNARFIRDIVSEQGILGFGYSELLRKLYLKEHGSSGKKDDEEKSIDNLMNPDSIEVRFPSPVSLNMTNLNDQINNLNTLVGELVEILEVPVDDKEAAQPIFKREMFKKYLPNMDWDGIETITKKVIGHVTKAKLLKKGAEDTDSGGDEAGAEDDLSDE